MVFFKRVWGTTCERKHAHSSCNCSVLRDGVQALLSICFFFFFFFFFFSFVFFFTDGKGRCMVPCCDQPSLPKQPAPSIFHLGLWICCVRPARAFQNRLETGKRVGCFYDEEISGTVNLVWDGFLSAARASGRDRRCKSADAPSARRLQSPCYGTKRCGPLWSVVQLATILLTANTYFLFCAGKFAIPTDPAGNADYFTVCVGVCMCDKFNVFRSWFVY